MAINEKNLTKGQIRKLNALRKSVGDKLASEVFAKWLKEQAKKHSSAEPEPVADQILDALSPLAKDRSIRLGNRGYSIHRARGKGAKGFVVRKIK